MGFCVVILHAGRGVWIDAENIFFIHQRISQRAVRTALEKQLDPEVQLLLEGGPYQYC